MLKIERTTNGEVVLALTGRLKADRVNELSALLDAECGCQTVVLDLNGVVLVDRETVRFLRECERNGIAIRNCPPYVREWIEREPEQS
jgi:anti-anti-sigma regulatory factor